MEEAEIHTKKSFHRQKSQYCKRRAMTSLKGNFSLCEQAVCSFRTTRNVGGENESLYQRASFPGIISAQGTEVIQQRRDIAESFHFQPEASTVWQVWEDKFEYASGPFLQASPLQQKEGTRISWWCSARRWNSSAHRYSLNTWAGNHGNCFKCSRKSVWQ